MVPIEFQLERDRCCQSYARSSAISGELTPTFSHTHTNSHTDTQSQTHLHLWWREESGLVEDAGQQYKRLAAVHSTQFLPLPGQWGKPPATSWQPRCPTCSSSDNILACTERSEFPFILHQRSGNFDFIFYGYISGVIFFLCMNTFRLSSMCNPVGASLRSLSHQFVRIYCPITY